MSDVLEPALAVNQSPVQAPPVLIETSIIIRTLNEAQHLDRLLDGIREQTYQAYEIIVIDSGSTDGTLEIAQRPGVRLLHIAPEDFTFGRALNQGCAVAEGQFLVFVSAHTYPMDEGWLERLVAPLRASDVAMVYGSQRGISGSRISEARDWERFFVPMTKMVDEPYSHNGNAAVRRDLWETQPFNEQLTGLEDLDWARKIHHRGYRICYAGESVVHHVHRESLPQLYRRFYREAIACREVIPRYRMTILDAMHGLAYNIPADLIYALRRRVSLGQILAIPMNRMIEYWATLRGLSAYTRVNGRLRNTLTNVPQAMASVVVSGAGKHGLIDRPLPAVATDEVLIQVGYVGVCATDVEVVRGQLTYYQKGKAHFPIVPGHEYSGMVAAVGSGVEGVRVGDKVVGECVIGCGDCSVCARAEHYRCSARKEVGVMNMDGAYAQYVSVPWHCVHTLPRNVTLKEAALIEPMAVVLKGLRKLQPQSGRTACVIGAGPLGNLCAQMLMARGVRVTVSDNNTQRLRLLQKYDVQTQDAVSSATYDYMIEATGNAAIIPDMIATSKPGVRILLLGLPYSDPVMTSFASVPCYDKEIIGSIASERQDWEEAIRLLRHNVCNLDDHTSTVLPLSSYGMAWTSVQEQHHFKVLLICNNALAGY
jgi:2-desacetyl-2-hydroxyethyl bacteriochlorophyllide A dehydrogenase